MNNNDKRAVSPETERYNKTTKTGSALKRGRFNFVDAFLVLVILGAIAMLLAYFLPGISAYLARNDEYHVVYKIEFRGVDGDVELKNIKQGMPVYDAQNHYEIGKIKSAVSVMPHTVLVNSGEENENGEYKGNIVEHPTLKNVVITVECTAIYSGDDESFMINGQRIAIGKEFSIRLGGFTGVGYCVSFDPFYGDGAQ